ncbi:MAG: KH domain-containing protein [Nitrososphaeria archaeon]
MGLRMEVKIPRDRIGALIGKGGKIKEAIEKECGVKIEVNSGTGDVTVSTDDQTNLVGLNKALNIAKAIGRGFSYERAKALYDDDYMLDIIDLTDYAGKSESNLVRIKGRIIGADGKARRIIEDLTDTYISVYGHTVSIIGKADDVKAAREAIETLAEGSLHKTVYERLQRRRSRMKLERFQLWERRGEELEGDIF